MLLLVDLDGVVYRGPDPVPGVAEVLARRARRGDELVFVTNNSMHYRADYVARLRSMGLPVTPDRVVSAPRATALFLVGQASPPARVLAVGAEGLFRELRDVGLEVVRSEDAAPRAVQERIDGFEAAGRPDTVVVGLDPGLTYGRIAVAADAARGAQRHHRPEILGRHRRVDRVEQRVLIKPGAQRVGRQARLRSLSASPSHACSRRRLGPAAGSRARP